MRTALSIFIFLFLTLNCLGQNDSVSEKGFYIPKDIEECNLQLDKFLGAKARMKLKQVDESRLDKIKGIFLIDEWFDNDSTRLAQYFERFGITDWQERDLMILLSYHRQLNNKPFDIVSESRKITHVRDSLQSLSAAAYKRNITADSIDGVLIPTDLQACFIQLDKLLSDTVKADIKNKENGMDLVDYHMGLGRWLRNNWGLWGGSRLQVYFENRGVSHPDDMSGIILKGYHQYLKGRSIDADQLIEEEKTRRAEFMKHQNTPPKVLVPKRKNFLSKYRKEDFYSKEYKQFLRTRRINDIDVYDW